MDRTRRTPEPSASGSSESSSSSGSVQCPTCGEMNTGTAAECTSCQRSLVLVTESTAHRDSPSFWSGSGLPPVEEPLDFAPGQLFASRYIIIDRLGQGGMGVVYKARDQELSRIVALKMIRSSLIADPESLERFRREPGLAQQVTHENVCRVHDLGVHQGIRYLSMEYLEANTLLDMLAKLGRLSVLQTLSIGSQVAAGIHAIHQRGIVHRDLKPSNVAVDRTRRAVVMDFGLARGSIDPELTAPGALVGSYGYLAPEHVQGRELTFATDLFALGLLLYEMLTGTRPPGDPSDQRPLALRGEESECPPPSTLAPDVSPELDAVVMRCLGWRPEDRPESAAAVRDELESCLIAEQARTGTRQISRAPRVAWAALATALLIAVLLGGLAATSRWSPTDVPDRTTRIAVAPFESGSDADDSVWLKAMGADAFEQTLRQTPGFAIEDVGTAEWTLRGTVATDGGETTWELGLSDEHDRTRWSRNLTGSSPVADLGELTRELLSGPFGVERPVSLTDATTDELDAYRSFLRARALHDGWYAAELGDLEKARSLYQESLRADPGFALAHAGQAMASTGAYLSTRSEGDRAVAQYAAGRAVAFGEGVAEPHLAQGTYLVSVDDWDAARREFDRAFALVPYDDHAMRRIADLYDFVGRPEEAHAIYRRALEERPDAWENYYWYGRSLFDAGELDEAPVHLEKAIELNPRAPGPLTLLGFFHLSAGDLPRARSYYERAHELEDDLISRRALGLVAYYSGDYETALGYWESTVALAPGIGIHHAELGDALRQLGRHEDATRSYRRALQLLDASLTESPTDIESAAERAQVLAAMGECGEARSTIQDILETHGHNTQYQYYGALTAGRCGQLDWAVDLVLPAIGGGTVVGIEYDPDLAAVRQDPRVRRPLELIGFGES